MMFTRVLALGLLATVCAGPVKDEEDDISDCLQKDSISCVQLTIYRHIRTFFDRPATDLPGGFSLEHGTSFIPSQIGGSVEMARSVQEREVALQTFIAERISTFVTGSHLKWNLAPALDQLAQGARSLAEQTPSFIKDWITNFVTESRSRRRKLFFPLLLLGKMKMSVLFIVGSLAIAVIAKKALLAGLLSLLVSVIVGLKKTLWHDEGHYHGYSSHHSHDWARKNDESGDHSLVYNAHQPENKNESS